MKSMSISKCLVASLCLAVTTSVMAYQDSSAQDKGQGARSDSRKMQTQVVTGQKMKVQGTVLKRDNNGFILRDTTGSEMAVHMTGTTKIEEKKGNPFRGAKKYSTDQVTRGLFVEVEGRGDGSGGLAADKIRFSTDAQKIALSIDTQVVPVENRMGQAETRLTEAEQNAQRLSGQVDELTQVANLAKGGAAEAQKTADVAVEGVNRTNDRISSLDDYQEQKSMVVNFKVGSAILSPDAKATLDELATQAKSQKGFVIEVRGFASSDGSSHLNDRLSEQRADAVVRYLAREQEIPLRRIILPFGYGTSQPVADNSTHEGRVQNRRVEVKILVSRGLTTPVNVDHPVTSGAGRD
jgi:outer membrane protein OmpA-like peptidoglycan-associated protein